MITDAMETVPDSDYDNHVHQPGPQQHHNMG